MPANFILLEPDPIICLDLTDMLRVAFPASDVQGGTSLDQATPLINKSGAGTTVLVCESLLDFNKELVKSLTDAAERGAKLVVIGGEPSIPLPAQVLHIPFSSKMVLDLITDQSDQDGLPVAK